MGQYSSRVPEYGYATSHHKCGMRLKDRFLSRITGAGLRIAEICRADGERSWVQ